jgi:putative polymerase
MMQMMQMPRLAKTLPSILVIWATVFNAVLAVVNAHVTALSPIVVIAAEVGTVGMAHFLALKQFREEMKPWYVLLTIIFVLFLVRSILTSAPEIRYVRDVLIIPTFVLLGMTSLRENLTKTVCVIHGVVLAVMFYEAIDTDGFSRLFEIQNYYINTRGYDDANFWNKESDLFVSAVRPQDRIFLPFLDLHRLSSIFLEPVSLGNYCVVITAFVCSLYPSLSLKERLFLGIGNVAVLIGCDGRLAAISSLIIIFASMAANKFPRGSAVLYLPGVTLVAILVTNLAGFRDGPDDLAGRVAHTVALLEGLDIAEYGGISERFLWPAVDSGVVYMILTQSLIGLSLIWIMIVFGSREDRLEQIRYTHALCIYLSFAMMISFSIFTIKTAGLLWFVQGALQRRERVSPSIPWLARAVMTRRQKGGRKPRLAE